VGLDCRHPGDRHPSKGAHDHIIGMDGTKGKNYLMQSSQRGRDKINLLRV
jgi:hypothetical protein